MAMFGIALLIHRSVRNVHEMVFRRLWEGFSEQREVCSFTFQGKRLSCPSF